MKDLLNKYFELQKQIHAYFGYEEQWRVIPIEDATEYWWSLNEADENVKFCNAENSEEARATLADDEKGDFYQNSIYTQRHLPKFVYESNDYTMICVDTQTDGNKFLQIFDNTRRIGKI